MPTNILRKAADQRKPQNKSRQAHEVSRIAVLKAGRVSVRVALADTSSADLVWRALPLYSTAVTWGQSFHFEVPLETGRDRTARLLGSVGDVYFWVEEDRIIVPFGATPISRPGECRLHSPSNLIGHVLDDVSVFSVVTPGEKVSLLAA